MTECGEFNAPPLPEDIKVDKIRDVEDAQYCIDIIQEYIGYNVAYWHGLHPVEHYIDALDGVSKFVKFTDREFDNLAGLHKQLRDLEVHKAKLEGKI